MGYRKEEMTGHGFRSMASTLLNERGFPRDALERQLAHGERDADLREHVMPFTVSPFDDTSAFHHAEKPDFAPEQTSQTSLAGDAVRIKRRPQKF